MVDSKYEVLFSKIKSKVKEALSVSLTTDVWTETFITKSYLGVTCHSVDIISKEMCSILLSVKELSERHDASYLGEELKSICAKWEIPLAKVICVTTDQASNIVKAVSGVFGPEKHLNCFAHTINLIANKPFHFKDSIPEVKELISSVKEIVTFFKQSVPAADELRKCQTESDMVLKLIQSVITRWNSTYYQIERFCKLSPFIAPILLKQPNAPNMISSSGMQIIQDLIKIFKPFEVLTKEVSAEKHATSSLVIPLVNCLNKTLEKITPKTSVGEKTIAMLLLDIEKRYGQIENNKILAISTILDPKFKKLHFKNHVASSKIISHIKSLVQNPSNNDKQSSTIEYEEECADSIWTFHKKLALQNQCGAEAYAQEEKNVELRTYLLKPVSEFKINLVSFWCHKKNESFSNLWEIALRYHTVMATSVPSERVFSQAGNIITSKRSRLQKLDELMFLKSVDFKDWCL